MAGSKPDLVAYVVHKKDDQDKGFWREVGAIWKHGQGDGFTLKVHPQFNISGDIVCMPRRDEANRPAAEAKPRATGPKR